MSKWRGSGCNRFLKVETRINVASLKVHIGFLQNTKHVVLMVFSKTLTILYPWFSAKHKACHTTHQSRLPTSPPPLLNRKTSLLLHICYHLFNRFVMEVGRNYRQI